MAEQAKAGADRGGRGGGRGFGRGGERGGDRGGRGGGRGGRDGGKGGARGPRNELDDWNPVTKLGRLVKYGKIGSLEEIFRFSIPIKESQIVDTFIKDDIKEEVMEIRPVQKQTRAGQRTRFKAFVVIGDQKGHMGLGSKCSKEV
jgi:small subunit ribosomal protein S2e